MNRSACNSEAMRRGASLWSLLLPDAAVDRLVRRKYRASLYDTPLDRFTVRVARTVEEHRMAFRLLKAAYDCEGLTATDDNLRITPQHVLPESTIFVAYEQDRMVGTLTVTLDSPAGLPLDHDYAPQLDELRAQGARLAEYGSLMVVRRCLHAGVATLLNMAAHWFARDYLQASHCVAGVHPRIAPYYRAMYSFRPLGDRAQHAELFAPVLGMVQDLAVAEHDLGRHFPGTAQSGLPLIYHYADELPACVQMPPVRSLEALARWKLSREVFRSLFIEDTDHVATLDRRTKDHLAGWRSIRTRSVGGSPKPRGYSARANRTMSLR